MQGIHDVAEILAQNKITNIFLSPGSRCAPLTNAMVAHKRLKTYSIIDERSAGFYAIGASLATNISSALVCTSGSAGLNYAPAVAEAFFQEIPLIILTADRPPELIDQYDGQTIFQEDLFGKHVKKSFSTPLSYDTNEIETIVQNAIVTANTKPFGPVHINIPLKEPLYSDKNIVFSSKNFRVNSTKKEPKPIDEAIIKAIHSSKNAIIVLGQGEKNDKLEEVLASFPGVILKDIHSNCAIGITEGDTLNYENLPSPDLVITLNKSLISKKLKLYLRSIPNLKHVHIGTDRIAPNTFNCTIGKIVGEPENIIPKLKLGSDSNFIQSWVSESNRILKAKVAYLEEKQSTELSFYKAVLDQLGGNITVHFANSMAIRYGNILQNYIKAPISVQCNRGTSGIDGSTSTAAGYALQEDKLNLILTGDLSFFYDRNAFWNPSFPTNLKIIVFNNKGGGIFNMIPGPNLFEESKHYFTTPRDHSAKYLAKEYNIKYFECDDIFNFDLVLKDFFKESGTTIFEINTDQETNTRHFKALKDFITN